MKAVLSKRDVERYCKNPAQQPSLSLDYDESAHPRDERGRWNDKIAAQAATTDAEVASAKTGVRGDLQKGGMHALMQKATNASYAEDHATAAKHHYDVWSAHSARADSVGPSPRQRKNQEAAATAHYKAYEAHKKASK